MKKLAFINISFILFLVGCSSTPQRVEDVKPVEAPIVMTAPPAPYIPAPIIVGSGAPPTMIYEPPMEERSTNAEKDIVVSESIFKESKTNKFRTKKPYTKSKSKRVEIVVDKVTYTIACPFFQHELVIKPSKKGNINNFYIPIKNLDAFKHEYTQYQHKFNQYIYECSKPRKVEGKQKFEGSTVVREEVAETVMPTCKKFNIEPVRNSFNKWIHNPTPMSIKQKSDAFNTGILTKSDMTNKSEYNKDDLIKTMDEFTNKVNKYNTDKKGDLFN